MKKTHYHIRYYLTLFFYLHCFLGCKERKEVHVLSEKMIKYSTFSWYKEKVDNSFQPYINFFLQINDTGDYLLMKHSVYKETPKYFRGTIDDSIANMITITFPDTLYRQFNYFKTDTMELYNGFTHCFDYTNEQTNKRVVIQFVPSKAPTNIQKLAEILNVLIQSKTQKSSKPFELNHYENEIIKINKSIQFPKIQPPNIKLLI